MPETNETNEELLWEVEPDVHGAYETHLYTHGNEFWPEDLSLDADRATELSLSDINSYKGWYHVRNYGSTYQVIIPEAEYNPNYTGPRLLSKLHWFMNAGRIDLIEDAETISIRGCTNPSAWNYNPLASEDDGTCMIVPGYLLGNIPPFTMNALHTHGGELVDDDGHEYQGYYHVHGAGGLPAGVSAGYIMTGREWHEQSERLFPRDLGQRYIQEHLEYEELGTALWHNILVDSVSNPSDEHDVVDIFVDANDAGQDYEYFSIDNIISLPLSTALMQTIDYQFSELITDTRTPGIYGSKPKLITNLNDVEFDNELEVSNIAPMAIINRADSIDT